MSAFDALTKIKQAVTHPKTDHTLPKSRALAFKTITDKAALQGTKGQHCTLVHGDHWKEVKGNEVSNVKLDQKLTVSRHQTIKVVGNHKETIVGKVYQNIIGPHNVTNHTVRHETALGAFTKVFGDTFFHDDHDGTMVTASFHLEADGFNVTLVGVGLQAFGIGTSFYYITDFSLSAVHTEVFYTGMAIHNTDMSFWNFKNENGTVTSRVNGAETTAGGTTAHAQAARPSAGPRPGPYPLT